MIEYECNKCDGNFNIDKEDVKESEIKGRYIVCPLCTSRNIEKSIDYKKMMERKSDIQL